MKLHTLILITILPFTMPADAGMIEVARVDINRVQNQLGSQQLSWLHAPKGVRIAVRDVNRKIEALQTDMMEATTQDKLNEIQQMLSFYQSKRNMLISTVTNSSSQWQHSLHRFIKERFGEKYPLIFQQNSYNISQYAICAELRETDITEQVIAAIESELGFGEE